MLIIKYSLLLIFIYFTSCSSNDSSHSYFSKEEQISGEYIYRKSNEKLLNLAEPIEKTLPVYPWNENSKSLPLITKEFFRCKGNDSNPIKTIFLNGEEKKYSDCGGKSEHGLPIRDGKEFIYPILIDLLNYLQKKTQEKVIVTSGHRCPEHNLYIDPENSDLFSKHMLGAEVSFYVCNFENNPLTIINYLIEYYQNATQPSEFSHFERYEKGDINLKFKPWFNKEIFIKLFDKNEGRNFDNLHPHPYISIQVRFDRFTKENVTYTWNKAHRQYLKK